ncbi:MAG TPA: asparagine synthetase B [Pyrinomonadaceae bacterium]|nr:asparagine synthetase B [Pyrinomonadaceae bacterium]
MIKHRGIYPPDFYQEDNFLFAHSLMPVQGIEPVHQPLVEGLHVLIFAGELWQHEGETSDSRYLFNALCNSDNVAETLRTLNGMFALVFKDKRTIYFASDVFGEVPLYFWHSNYQLSVASEIKQLVAIGAPLKEVRAARPGVLYTFRNNMLFPVTYHNWSFTNNALDFDAEYLRNLIRESVREHYMTIDLQQSAVLLSGGLDSTIIAYELAQLGLKEAYTVGITYDCTDFLTAQRTCEQLGLRHTTVIASELDLDCAIAITEVSNRSVVEEFCCHIALSNALRANNVHVVFSGSGADEMFVGYQHLLRFYTKEKRKFLQQHFIEKHHTLDLRAANKTYMLNAIEVRNPFLSYKLMDYAATLDVDKILVGAKRQMKLALRQAYEPVIGDLAYNPKLIAFETMGVKQYFRSRNGDSPFIYRKRFKDIFSQPLLLRRLVDRAKTLS